MQNRIGVLIDQVHDQAGQSQEVQGLVGAQVGQGLYTVTEGTCETSRTSSAQEGVMHDQDGHLAADSEEIVCGRSSGER